MEEYREEQQREAVRQSIVEQERQRLLREHAAKLLGYLPRVSPPQPFGANKHVTIWSVVCLFPLACAGG